MVRKYLPLLLLIILVFGSSSCGRNKEESILYGSDMNLGSITESPGAALSGTMKQTHTAESSPKPEPPSTPVPPSTEPGLLFMDDLDDGFDAALWTAVLRHENYNNELQFYWPDNVFTQDGSLKLRAYKEEFCGYDYTSGMVSTQGKLAFKYADIEIRARHPVGKGLFAALWLSPAEGEDYLPEIDIMEVVGDEPVSIWVVYHFRDFENKKRTTGNYLDISNLDAFHTYRLEWSENSISWYIDGGLVHTTNRSPDVSMNLVMNLAVGGDWPGDPSESTVFPADFEIDYVKVYQNQSSGG